MSGSFSEVYSSTTTTTTTSNSNSSSNSTHTPLMSPPSSTILALQIEYHVYDGNNNSSNNVVGGTTNNNHSNSQLGGSFTENNNNNNNYFTTNSGSSSNNSSSSSLGGSGKDNNSNINLGNLNINHTTSSNNLTALAAASSQSNSIRRGQLELIAITRVQEAIRLISDRFLKTSSAEHFNPYNFKLYLRQPISSNSTIIANTNSSIVSTLNSKSELYQLTDLNRTLESYNINNNTSSTKHTNKQTNIKIWTKDILVIRMNKRSSIHHGGSSPQITPTKSTKKDGFFRSIFSSSSSSRGASDANSGITNNATSPNTTKDDSNKGADSHPHPATAATEILASFQYYGNEMDYAELLELHQNNTVEKSGYRNSKLLANFLLYLLQNICVVQSVFAKEIASVSDTDEKIEQFDRLPPKNRVVFKHILVLLNKLTKANEQLSDSLAGLIAPCIIDWPSSASTMDRIDQLTYSYLINDKPLIKEDIEKRLNLSKDILNNYSEYMVVSRINNNNVFQ
ncbi:hypothetical protein PPL_08655 [Heterostelium album PN500]|uniref:Uncharacterized protein n=1 Tax=Heterostelium pallidum (strain ATCC 26659 / Pp 5 / PN500) TaxID=670386 RepID=D3BJD0_HETP5|nr:hypothetical protein PPL_08655 [Heterostelium album PN500]EFA78010.1 hypothetical protein PPL_08655 [Heterostelium album PN500]|eukprot:XP_020430138.1 hypothetical protein PPL_08655 [Heterostelium album PN500]